MAKFRGKLDDQPWKLSVTWGLHLQWFQVDRSFEVTNVHQFKDPEFMAATKEILREFVLDLQESWHEIRSDPEWHLHLHFLDLREASKDSIFCGSIVAIVAIVAIVEE